MHPPRPTLQVNQPSHRRVSRGVSLCLASPRLASLDEVMEALQLRKQVSFEELNQKVEETAVAPCQRRARARVPEGRTSTWAEFLFRFQAC